MGLVVLELKNLSCGYPKKTVLENITISIKKGEILSLLGANGVGKTTLFKTIIGFLKPHAGEIFINGSNSSILSDKQRASILGYVPQSHIPPFPFSVFEVVLMGRTSKLKMFENPGKKDKELALEAINKIGITHLKDRIYTELSGGERQMVLIARALSTGANILILDEPTSNLDFGNQMKILNQINRFAHEGLSIIMTTHNPQHVFQTDSNVVLIEEKNSIICGRAKDVISKNNLKKIYGIDVEIIDLEIKEKIITSCIPIIN